MRARGLVVVRGGGDLGTGVAHRLVRAGFRVVVLETARPTVVRRAVAFAEAVPSGKMTVEGVVAKLVDLDEITDLVAEHARLDSDSARRSGRWPVWVPVIVDPGGLALGALGPDAVVDARMAKRDLGTTRGDAPVTIGLGPGFEAGRNVDLVVETLRGHSLGRVIDSGEAEPNTGVPGDVGGADAERVMRSPAEGAFRGTREIGALVEAGEIVGTVAGQPVRARIAGLLRGLVADGVILATGGKVGDVDPRGEAIDPRTISDKARAVAGGVLEALLSRGVLPDGAGTRLEPPGVDASPGAA